MAQIDFYFSRDEKLELAALVFSMGLKMIPDLSYSAKKVTFIRNIDEYEAYLFKNELMLIVNPDIDENLLVWGSFEKAGIKSYFVRQQRGVSTTDFYSPGMVESNERRIGPSFVGNQPFYFTNEGAKLKPSASEKTVYKTLQAFVKKNAVPAKLSVRTFWIGKKTLELCKNASYRLVTISDKNPLDYL
jgi:hypothetical protein